MFLFLFQHLRAYYEARVKEKVKHNIPYYGEDPDLPSRLGAMSLNYASDEDEYDPCDEYVYNLVFMLLSEEEIQFPFLFGLLIFNKILFVNSTRPFFTRKR